MVMKISNFSERVICMEQSSTEIISQKSVKIRMYMYVYENDIS